MKKISYFMMFAFLLSLFTISAGNATLDNLEEGDTLYYKVSTFNVPLETILTGADIGLDPADIVLDLTGSTLGLKVMRTSSDGTYILNPFVILGKDIKVPLPDNADPVAEEIFGSDFILPAGIGFSLGLNIPGSNWISETDRLPVYLEPDETASTYKALFEGLVDPSGPGEITVDDGTDVFTVTFELSAEGNTVSLTAEWFKTGDNAGLFKSLQATASLDNEGTQIDLALGFSFDHKENHGLPTEITSKQMQTFSVDSANFDLTFSGELADQVPTETTDGIDEVKTALSDVVGEDILRMSIGEVDGMFYTTTSEINNPTTNSWEPVFGGEGVWYNGFSGSPTGDPDDPNFINSLVASGAGVIPIAAPGITPDWTVSQANLKTVQSLANIVSNAVNSPSASNQLLQLGLKVNQFSIVAQLRESSGFKYQYVQLDAQVSYKASDAQTSFRPDGFDGSEEVTLSVSLNAWTSYSDSGLLAGAGVEATADLTVTNIPIGDPATPTDGGASFNLNVKIKNNDVSSLPDGKAASPVGGGGGLLPGIPGFEFIPLFGVLVVTVYAKKRKTK